MRAYKRAITIISKLERPVCSQEDLKNEPGISLRLLEQIDVFFKDDYAPPK